MSKNYTPSLAWNMAAMFLLFVVAGSSLLIGSLHRLYAREARDQFRLIANTAAYFIQLGRIAPSPLLADHLQRIMGVDVYFAHGADIEPVPPHSWPDAFRAQRRAWPVATYLDLQPGRELIAVDLEARTTLILDRPRPSALQLLWQPQTALALGAFWLGAFGLGVLVTRRVVHPIRRLTARVASLPDADETPRLPGRERPDEIGQLARALETTHARRLDETARRRRAERLSVLGRISAGLAHEIRNPLAAIRMHADLLDASGEQSTGAARSIGHIRREADRVRELVEQRLYLAKPEPPAFSAVDLGAILRAALERWRVLADASGVVLETAWPDAMPGSGDASRLEQAFGNIVLNAIQAMPSGGVLLIEAESRGGCWRLSFLDSGPGFSTEALRRATELFYSEREGGLGIGLGLAREIVEAHGGTLHLGNRAKGGAVVRVALAARQEETEHGSAADR
jgi:signal transduction histidine kinase